MSDRGRPYLAKAEIGCITQGTVFTCGFASRYMDQNTYGVAITARCDIAQNKYRILNYIPIVELSDWLLVDGLEILLAETKKDLLGRIRRELISADLSPSIMLSVSLDEIASTHFPEHSGTKAEKARSTRFKELVDTASDLSRAENDGAVCALDWLKTNRSKRIAELIKRLSQQEVSGFYFLERLLSGDVPTGYVCLLREITTLPKDLADELARGITRARWDEIYRGQVSGPLNFSCDDFGMPISRIASPTIEHLMQFFSNLFGRIGLPDPISEEIDEIIATQTQVSEDAS